MRKVWVLLVLSLPVMAASSKPVICKNGSDTRVLKSQKTESGGCEVVYEKNGKVQTVDSSSDAEQCGASLDKMRSTLEGAGFQCR